MRCGCVCVGVTSGRVAMLSSLSFKTNLGCMKVSVSVCECECVCENICKSECERRRRSVCVCERERESTWNGFSPADTMIRCKAYPFT